MTYRDKRILGILVLLNVIVKILANQTDSPKTDMVEGTEDFTTIKKVLPDRCLAKIDQGPCTQFVHKWYFNKTEGKCRTFPYGGCKGNDNRYNSEDECLYYCVGGADHTLPPYLVTKGSVFVTTSGTTTTSSPLPTTSSTPRPTFTPPKPTKPPVPKHKRGKELTFMESGHEKTFMFAQSNTFIQLDGSGITTFQLRLCREISFKFRTKLPHGLLVYHSVKNRPEGLDPYALYVIVEKGQLKVVHVFGKQSTSLTVGEGLNRDEWHSVLVRIDVHGAKLIARVDDKKADTTLKVLERVVNYGVSEDLASVVLIGGLSSEERLHGVKYIIESFVGCIRDMVLSSGKSASDLLPIRPLIATKHENVKEGCIDKCRTRENLCFVPDQCVNHYNSLTCDCFGTKYEGERCDVYTATILTLRGSSYVSFRVYDWKDRVHSSVNRISLAFKTKWDDSALFYASGEIDGTPHYIAASIINGSVYVELDFGHNSKISTMLGDYVTSDHWNNLIIFHNGSFVFVSLDDEVKVLEVPGENYNMIIDPEIYIGGGPELHKKKGLLSHNNFAGSLKYVFFNDKSIIYELKRSNPMVHYIGVLEPEYYEADVEVIPITYPFAESHIWWPVERTDSLKLNFDFKSSKPIAVVASGDIKSSRGVGYWELRQVNDEIRFQLIPVITENITVITSVKFPPYNTSWHAVELNYTKGELNILLDYKNKQSKLFALTFELGDKVIIGSGIIGGKNNAGLVGCMREIQVNNQRIEPRYVINTERVIGEVALDNCQFVDPCKRPNTCEHGGKCSVKEDRITCDCTDTGYIGKNCHFAQYRKTCEELALLGFTQDDVYKIDIDGNGRFPPASVKCEFQSIEDSTKTIVEHNLPSQVDVRSVSENDFSFNIKYRQFTAEMLQELISHSLYCSQYVKYDCYKAPLELHSATWFLGSKGTTVDYIGNVNRGSCPCGMNRTCVNSNLSCNCDVSAGNAGKWLSDEGYYETPDSLGITGLIFLQQKDLEEDAQGRITLGPLECVETNTQKYVVTFTTSQSYIEVPGWRKGDIAFSFRTTGEKAILLYQPPIRNNYPSFMVALTSEYHLTFNFTLNTGTIRELEVRSRRKLNNGEWQKIWIDYNDYHVRFMINTDFQMVDLLPEEEFGPFEGSMFIGGATAEHLKTSSVRQGLIGCFRGLVVNGEILDIHSYMSVHLSEIIKDCKPSCQPNKCQNGARCVELWSNFECVCENRWAHLGTFCETNINNKALTFTSAGAFLKKNYFESDNNEEKLQLKSMLQENILINLRTYDTHSLILYANDHLNNFVHLYISNGTNIVYLFNAGNEIKNITVSNPNVNTGISVQIAIIRGENWTTLHVNEYNVTLNAVPILLDTYSNKPWTNPEKEVLAPQRPPAPPTDYFQVNLGGFDSNLLRVGQEGALIQGYVGCLRGLMIGKYLVDLPNLASEANHEGKGVLPNCQMKCDAMPCKNLGICTEDFNRQESSCNCELTSYFGEYCADEKGADFSGESVLQREFELEGEVNQVKVQLAFSTSELRQRTTALLLVQTDNKRSYYLLVALTSEGQLIFEEDRDGSAAYGVRLNDRNFLNGARHSVYYVRDNTTATLLIDRQPAQLIPLPGLPIRVEDETAGATEIQLGGLNTTDSRFIAYKGYTGCLSNVVISINGGPGMKPLEEYMLFTKQASETVRATIPAGVRSAQCAVFHIQPGGLEPPGNVPNIGRDREWVEDPPEKIPYKSQYSSTTQEEQGAGTYIFIVLCCVFVAAVTGCIYEVWRSARKDRQRRHRAASGAAGTAASGSQRWQPPQYTESLVTTTGVKAVGFKNVMDDDKRPNGTHMKAPGAKEYKPLPNTEPKDLINEKKVHIKADEEPEKKELLGVNTGIITKPAKPNPFSMEDLREEPELEEREEKEEAEEEEEDVQEQGTDKNKDQSQEQQQEEQEKNENNDQDNEPLVRPVRNKLARGGSLTDELDPDDTQALLETNFSVTGLNEIKTERIIPRVNNTTKNITIPKRPMSLDLNAPIKFRKLREGAWPEKVTAKLLDGDEVSLQSRGRGYNDAAYRTQDK